MATDIQALRDQREAFHAEALKINATAEGEDRAMTDDENTVFLEKISKRDAINGRIEQAEALARFDMDMDASAGRQAAGTARARAVDSPGTKSDDIQVGKDRLEDDPKLGFKHIGEFGSDVWKAAKGGQSQKLEKLAAITGLGTSVGSEGGFLVPPAFSTTVWDGLNSDADSLIGMCDNLTVDPGFDSISFPANAETSRATGSRYGGIQGYWLAEANQITSSKPKIRQVKFEPQELGALVYVTDKLARNAGGLSQWLGRAMTEDLAFMSGDAIINGNGTGKPKGILAGTAGTTSCRVSVTKESGQTAATVVYQNILKMWSRMNAKARVGAIWLINQDVEPQLHSIEFPVGTGGLPGYMPPGGLSATPFASLLGRPVVPIEYCATLGTEGDIILANMGFYGCATRNDGISSAASMHLRFDYAETALRVMMELDGKTWLESPITPYKGTATQSPFVTIATRA